MTEFIDWWLRTQFVVVEVKDIFHQLEDSCLLDSNSEFNLFALHYICLPRINPSLEQFVEKWNFHGIRTAGYQSPMALWHAGILHSTDDGEFINQNLMVLTLNLLC